MIPQPWTQCYNQKALVAVLDFRIGLTRACYDTPALDAMLQSKALVAALNFRMRLTRACNDTPALDAMLQSKSTRGSFEFSHGFKKGLQ